MNIRQSPEGIFYRKNFPRQLYTKKGGGKIHVDIGPILNPRTAIPKPSNTFWTSTFTPNSKYCSAWLEWCSTDMKEWMSSNSYVLWPDPEARVVELKDKEDLLTLLSHYSYKSSEYRAVDFRAVSEKFEGIHLTREGVQNLASASSDLYFNKRGYYSLYGWDTESTVWFVDVFRSIEHIVDVPHSCRLEPERWY